MFITMILYLSIEQKTIRDMIDCDVTFNFIFQMKIKKKMINEFKTHRFQFYERDRFDVVDASQKTIQNNNRSESRDREEFRERDRDRDRENFNFNQSFEKSSNRSQIEC